MPKPFHMIYEHGGHSYSIKDKNQLEDITLNVEKANLGSKSNEKTCKNHEEALKWICTYLYHKEDPKISNLYIWCAVMFFFQISALLLLTFEQSQLTDANNIILYVSNNIDDHRGFGALMLISFLGSLFVINVVVSDKSILWKCGVFVLIAICVSGGTGTVLFHDPYKYQHIASAAVFIISGLLLHLIAILALPYKIHKIRDSVLFVLAVTSAIVFATFLIITHVRAENEGVSDSRDPKYKTLIWISGTSEYLLYIFITILNFLVYERVIEYFAGTELKRIDKKIHNMQDK